MMLSDEPGAGEGLREDATDRSLLKWVQHGSEDAATQLYGRYAHRLRALVRENCSVELARRVDAEDIVQSVFRSFFEAASQGCYTVPAGEDLWKLLLVTALNKIRAKGTYHRAAKRDVRLTRSIDGIDEARETSRSKQGELPFLQVLIDEALEHLPPPHQEMVRLRIEGYGVAEIAARTGRAKRSVERLLQESRKRLSVLLQEDI
jgi:RNA polymerase sigma-70 factor (ECF subfamily)